MAPNPLLIPDPDQPVEAPLLNDLAAWEARVTRNLMRLATDEAYREAIAKKKSEWQWKNIQLALAHTFQ